MVRSVVAIVVGYLVVVALTTALSIVIPIIRPDAFPTPDAFPPTSVAVVILIAGLLFIAIGGHVCATIARRAPVLHGLILGGVALILGIISALVSTVDQPLWYQAGLALSGLIGAPVGASLRRNIK